MNSKWILGLFLLLLTGPASPFSHGLNTTFDPNSYGGNWTCFRSLASGTCGGATTQYFDAACDGVADDTAANAAMRAYAATHTPMNLYIPPGSNCRVVYDGTFSFTSGAHGLVVWAYGTNAVGNLELGGRQAFFQDRAHQALIADANAGDSTVTVTGGNIIATGTSIVSGGSGYAVNDTITLATTGGVAQNPTVLFVQSIGGGGAVTGVSILDSGLYSTAPTNPVAQASTTRGGGAGPGTGATFNLTAFQTSAWTIGHWIAVTGLSLQHGGIPSNFAFVDYKQITNIVGNVITLDSPLFNSYKSTWPAVSSGPPSGGPAAIFDLDPTWDTDLQWFGGTFNFPTSAQVNMIGRKVAFYDLQLLGGAGANPSASKDWSCTRCIIQGQVEIDKDNENVTFNYSSLGQITNASMNRNVTFNHVNTIGVASLNGTNRFTTITNGSSISFANIGPSFGHAETLTLNGSTITSNQCATQSIKSSWVTYSSGTFAIAIADPNRAVVISWAVPGYQYFFATVAPIVNLGKTFTVTGLRQDATNTYVDTDLVGALPSLGQTDYMSQPAPTVTATNMTGNSAPTNATGAWCHL